MLRKQELCCDTLKLTELGINTTTHDYWTAGTYQHDLLYSFLGHIIVTKDGYISTCALYRADEIEGTTTSTGAQTLHLRPIFKLLETVKVNTEGNRDGKSIATAYKLVV